jgi:hypothetical protein
MGNHPKPASREHPDGMERHIMPQRPQFPAFPGWQKGNIRQPAQPLGLHRTACPIPAERPLKTNYFMPDKERIQEI